MRIDVQKCLVIGPTSAKDSFFSRVQQLGVVEFLGDLGKGIEVPHEVQNLIDALHILRRMVPVKQAGTINYQSPYMLAAAALEHNETFERLKERHRVLIREISRVEPFGDFTVTALQTFSEKTRLQFQFFFKKGEVTDPIPDDLIFVSHQYGLNYYVAIQQEKQEHPGYIEMVIEQSATELKEELAEVNRRLDLVEIELSALAYQKKLLQKGLTDALNRYHLNSASQTTEELLEGKAFAVEAWIPKNKISQVKQVADELHLVVEGIAIEPRDKRPTYLENNGFGRLGEDLVGIYDIPSSTDRDPSTWVFFSFAVFFAMIVADAGYGLLIMALSSWLWFKMRKKGSPIPRIIKLAFWLSVGCIFWGIMLSSFFGIPVSPESPLRKVSVIHWAVEQKAEFLVQHKTETYKELIKTYPELQEISQTWPFLTSVKKQTDTGEKYVVYDKLTDSIMIELAIFIGVIHLMISLFRYIDRYWAAAGWIICLIGGYLLFPTILKATSLIYYIFHVPLEGSATVGRYMIYSGLGIAAVLAVIQNRLKGLAELMNVIQLFADVMSYLRIYALSLAGMIMAMTFNHIGASLPFYIGIFIFLAGHSINFTLAMMGGVIHGLRLNFIEWYHYSFGGGGHKFKPLSLLKMD